MPYQQNNNGFRHNNRQDRPKNVTITMKVHCDGIDKYGRNYNIQSAINLMRDLNGSEVFNKLSVPVQISRATLDNNPDARGNMTVGFIRNIDTFNNNLAMDVTIYSTFAEKINADDFEINPRMIINRDENVVTFLGFDIVKNLED